MEDYRTAGLAESDLALLEFAEKLTLHPARVEEADVERLRLLGFSDRAVLDAVQVVAYYNFVNRLAQGLGVELESPGEE